MFYIALNLATYVVSTAFFVRTECKHNASSRFESIFQEGLDGDPVGNQIIPWAYDDSILHAGNHIRFIIAGAATPDPFTCTSFRTHNFVVNCNEELTIIISRKWRLMPVRNGFRLDGYDIYMHVHIHIAVRELSRSDKDRVQTLVCGKENRFQRGIGSFPCIY